METQIPPQFTSIIKKKSFSGTDLKKQIDDEKLQKNAIRHQEIQDVKHNLIIYLYRVSFIAFVLVLIGFVFLEIKVNSLEVIYSHFCKGIYFVLNTALGIVLKGFFDHNK
ncbi:MAG: hypothetical protein A2287_04670 [Candidatus Melainabacteria bacterium RIFOXYA12_FULL_32_12]|nr:MAG: hypothetical protein A2287_04670 [Candidatus Melainabacteria bacterium RIFOXYA12_FULL_32_12]